jgi:hypothetical protein
MGQIRTTQNLEPQESWTTKVCCHCKNVQISDNDTKTPYEAGAHDLQETQITENPDAFIRLNIEYD